LCEKELIADILLRASVLSGDRRKTRYSRLRSAIANGLVPASALSVKQPKGKKRKVSNEAADPVLPEALIRRITDHSSLKIHRNLLATHFEVAFMSH